MDRKLKQTSLLSYWTIRYFIILCAGLLALAAAAVWWTHRETLDSRLQTVQLLAQELADRLDRPDGTIAVPRDLKEHIEKRAQYFKLGPVCAIVTDKDGKLLFSNEPLTQEDLRRKMTAALDQAREPGMKAITAPIEHNGNKIGQVSLLQPVRSLAHLPPEAQWALVLLLVSLTGLGWLTIYRLSRKLSRPIRKVASAAREISLGQYDVRLEANAKERELNELIVSFKDMAGKLKQLEHSRNFMLAGLTHELKTPVTSVKGLVHAVKEKIVRNEEADEFLEIALQETHRLERMIADLLDYNALAAGVVQVSRDRLDAGALLSEIVYQWTLHQDESIREPELSLPGQLIEVQGDPLRIQQILVNLLNNSAQARHPDRPLQIRIELLERDGGYAEIIVNDNGSGIPPSEQDLVFERFFRGESKKLAVRGLGLGLAFSRLIAQAQGGDLLFRESSNGGTSFSLTLPLASTAPRGRPSPLRTYRMHKEEPSV
ncbi:HAMP domain-containing protein [Cohnella sp. CFH 77786]|uniref:HAMP domain-containing sensor histidine kinase n=1 Tax=Cohnella sp. CFH 77786 TaxID=2662265 RepID=UPI001C60E69A|nr:HAMP domain-containing sensor histidine kinase [Cohnella sp. CFH 77786]MBW5447569.1 HAMP domain-containing protein [Cohnella sp. CFH 77786]